MAGYVHLVILIFFNVLFENVIGEGDSRYVAFVIDDTYSMADDIDQLKTQTHQLFDAVLTSDVTRYYDKFALVTFSDPSPGEVRIITSDPNAFERSLGSINVSGGGDCPELAMHGILNALNTCPSNSVIYVFTDGAAKDFNKFEEVKNLSLKKSIQNVIGEGDSRYVAFVIDDTYSMADDIDQLKTQTHQLFDAVLTSDVTRYYDKFALVTFSDPSPGEVRIITSDPNAFERSLGSINVSGGGDCPELAMHGILNALNTCPSNSVIYVFTDGAAKDFNKFEEVKNLSLKKSIQNVIGEGDSRYVAFVIDDTYSMADDIDQLKTQTHQLFDAVLTSDVTRYYDKFALVTFSDPSPGEVRIITSDPNAFERSLGSINVSGGGDCPELAMHGILNALNTCPSNSVIYVFTDGAAKDFNKFEEVKNLSLKKSIQITFLLTGVCDLESLTNESYLVYHKIAEATSGQVFQLRKSNIREVTKYISQAIASERHLISQLTSECPLDVTFKVDDKTGNVLIAASKFLKNVPEIDNKMSLKVFDAENNEVESYSMLDLQYTNILQIRNPKPGYYKAKLDCQDHQRTHLTITGSTSVGQNV